MHVISASAFVASLLSCFLTAVSAANADSHLYVSGYDGVVRGMALCANGTTATLSEIATSKDCGKNPSWLTIFYDKRTLVCLDEGFAGTGSVNYLEIGSAHDLKLLTSLAHDKSPVHARRFKSQVLVSFFGGPPGSRTGGLVQYYNVEDKALTKDGYVLFLAPSNNSSYPQQDVSRIHGIFTDPTQESLAVMDYGTDTVHVLNGGAPNSTDGKLQPGVEMTLPRGTGPRHAVFFTHPNTKEPVYLFVVSEMANTITTFNVSYDDKRNLHLSPPSRVVDTFGGKPTTEQMTHGKAAEIRTHGQFIIVSNRNATVADSSPPSDSLVTYRVNADGSLNFVQSVALGGLFPRSFSVTTAGDKIAVAAQTDSRLIILKRDPATGMIGSIIATHDFDTKVDGTAAGISSVIWDQ